MSKLHKLLSSLKRLQEDNDPSDGGEQSDLSIAREVAARKIRQHSILADAPDFRAFANGDISDKQVGEQDPYKALGKYVPSFVDMYDDLQVLQDFFEFDAQQLNTRRISFVREALARAADYVQMIVQLRAALDDDLGVDRGGPEDDER